VTRQRLTPEGRPSKQIDRFAIGCSRRVAAAITVRDAETSGLLYLRRPVISRDWLSVGE
jgi:hypothetical protein